MTDWMTLHTVINIYWGLFWTTEFISRVVTDHLFSDFQLKFWRFVKQLYNISKHGNLGPNKLNKIFDGHILVTLFLGMKFLARFSRFKATLWNEHLALLTDELIDYYLFHYLSTFQMIRLWLWFYIYLLLTSLKYQKISRTKTVGYKFYFPLGSHLITL